jgi:hypothetical protein
MTRIPARIWDTTGCAILAHKQKKAVSGPLFFMREFAPKPSIDVAERPPELMPAP